METSEWRANLESAREKKDAFFAQHWQSPIPPQYRPRFRGLRYYPPDQAYNPWCVYSEAYTCPSVPAENWLEVPVCAGEKDYPLRERH